MGRTSTKQTATAEGKLPRRPRGRPTPEADALYWAAVEEFATVIKEIDSGLELSRQEVREALDRMVKFDVHGEGHADA